MKKLVLTLLMIAVVLGGCSSLAVLGEETPTFTASDENSVNDESNVDSNIGTQDEGLYEVLRVVDGDTIEIDYNGEKEKVRLIGVDTPESVHPDAEKNTDYGKTAAEFTTEKLEGQLVSLEFDVEQRDKYGRLLAYVYLDGQMFNSLLLEEGHAMVSTYPPNVKYADLFLEQQQEAREAGVGLWADILTSGEYVASLNGSKYHLSSCSSAQKIKEENRIWFKDSDSAEAAGYEPCSICNP